MDRRRPPNPAAWTARDYDALERLQADIWWAALTTPPRPRARVHQPRYVRLLGWLLRPVSPLGPPLRTKRGE